MNMGIEMKRLLKKFEVFLDFCLFQTRNFWCQLIDPFETSNKRQVNRRT